MVMNTFSYIIENHTNLACYIYDSNNLMLIASWLITAEMPNDWAECSVAAGHLYQHLFDSVVFKKLTHLCVMVAA